MEGKGKKTRSIKKKTERRPCDVLNWVMSPFDEKLSYRGIVVRWFVFFVIGLVTLGGIQHFAQYDMSEADTLASETGEGCDRFAMAMLFVLPPIEELIFRIGPHKYLGDRAAFIGSMVWALLHIVGRNYAVVGFQVVMGVFYYKLVASGRYKETVAVHLLFNMMPMMTCL